MQFVQNHQSIEQTTVVTFFCKGETTVETRIPNETDNKKFSVNVTNTHAGVHFLVS